jgi:hypothetical protein
MRGEKEQGEAYPEDDEATYFVRFLFFALWNHKTYREP